MNRTIVFPFVDQFPEGKSVSATLHLATVGSSVDVTIVRNKKPRRVRLHWLLADAPDRLRSEAIQAMHRACFRGRRT